MKKLTLLSAICAICAQTIYSQAIPDLYLGLTPPGITPEIFAPGIVSISGRNERVITFSPNGHEIFFAIGDFPYRTTMYIQYLDSAWTAPVNAPFSATRSAEEPFFSLDGNRIYYYAYPPSSYSNANICYSEKNNGVWSDPISVGSSLNTTGDEFHPNLVNDGSIYFVNGAGKTYRAQYNSDGSFQPRVKLPNNINSGVWPDHYVAPDESYTIFTSTKAGGYGSSDLYISFKNLAGLWSTPLNLGSPINTAGYEGSADITPDGKYMTFDNLHDIYWVKIDHVIDSLKAVASVITEPDEQGLKIYPNPSNGRFSLSFSSSSGKNAIAEISNSEGKIILKRSIENDAKIDLTGNPKGIYILQLYINSEVLYKKIAIH